MTIIFNNILKTLTLISWSLSWHSCCLLSNITFTSLQLNICIFILLIAWFSSCWPIFSILRSSFLNSCCIKLSDSCFCIWKSLIWILNLSLTLLICLIMIWGHYWTIIELISIYLNIIIFIHKVSCACNYLWKIGCSILF